MRKIENAAIQFYEMTSSKKCFAPILFCLLRNSHVLQVHHHFLTISFLSYHCLSSHTAAAFQSDNDTEGYGALKSLQGTLRMLEEGLKEMN